METFDVVVVGARCAGSSLAAQLAQAGLAVCVVDRASFPSDTPSTHIFQRLDCLDRLGVMGDLRATGAPLITRMAATAADVDLSAELAQPMLCVRRPVLDTILLKQAAARGADVRTSVRVTELVVHGGRVGGVRVHGGAGSAEIAGRLVVGADGTTSTVGRLVRARRYNLVRGERFCYWAYYEGARPEEAPTVHLHRFGEEFVISAPADAGLHLAIALPGRKRETEFLADVEASFDAYIAGCEPVAAVLAGARRISRPTGMRRWTGFFRESAGPGWVLVGDAGHFKDPAAGQGISDSLRQAEALSAAVVAGLASGDLDRELQRWWRWRDDDAHEMHWFSSDLGKAGPVPPLLAEMFRQLATRPKCLGDFHGLFSHHVAPSKVLTPRRLLQATAHLIAPGRQPRRASLRAARAIISQDRHRRRRARRPEYEAVAADDEPLPADLISR